MVASLWSRTRCPLPAVQWHMKQLWIMLTNQVMISGKRHCCWLQSSNVIFGHQAQIKRSNCLLSPCQFTLTSPLSFHHRWKMTVRKSLPTWAQRRPPRWHPPAGVSLRPEPSASAGLQSYSESSFGSWWTPTPLVHCRQTHGQTGKRRSYNQLTPEAIVKKSLTTKWEVSESDVLPTELNSITAVSDIRLTMKSDAQPFNVAEI